MSIVTKLAPLFAANAHAVRFRDSKGKFGYRKVNNPLCDADLARHISKSDPDFSLGVYLLRDLANSKGHVVVLDLDDHDGDSGAETSAVAVKLCAILEEMEIPYLLFRSGGGKGFHVYLLFEELQTKSWLRAVGKHLVQDKLGFKEGAGGIKAGEIEIFPKGDRFGGENVIALPMARKSVALRREGDSFVEAHESTELSFCPALTQISDPGYGVSPTTQDHRLDFLAELIGYADSSAYAILPNGIEGEWQRVSEPINSQVFADPQRIVGVYFPIEPKTEKSPVLVIRTANPRPLSLALNNTDHFIVSSVIGPQTYFVWCVFAKPRRKDLLRKIATEAIKFSGDKTARFGIGGDKPAELPLCGSTRYVTGFDGDTPLFGPAPFFVPVNRDRPPGPKKKGADRDQAFDCLATALDPANYDQWVKCGHLLISAFGKDDPWTYERWATWSATSAKADPPDELKRKWDRSLAGNPKYSPASFWMAAKDAGEQFLRLQTFETAGELLSAEDLKAVVETIDAQCQRDGKRSPVHLRVARHGDKGYMFLGDDARTVIEFDELGCRECTEPPVKFRSAPGAKPLPMPVYGKIEDLRALFNLDDDNWALLIAWIMMTLAHPGRPAPICVLNGEHGSAKTAVLKQVIGLLDPKVGATAGLPKTEDDLIASAHSSHVVSFDNVSSLAAVSDALCRLATGGGLRKRQLFTDNSLAAYDVIRPVIVSGIDPTAYNLDIVERLFTIELIRPDIYLTDQEVTARFDAALPSCLGALLAFAGKVIARLPGTEVMAQLRMADFARVGEAVAQLMGQEPGWFGETYQEMLETAAAENSEGDPVFAFVEKDVTDRFSRLSRIMIGSEIKLKASDLHTAMMQGQRGGTVMANREDVPRNARVFSSRLFRIRKQLEEAGFRAEKQKSDRSWRFEVATADRLQKIVNRQADVAKARMVDEQAPF